MKKHKFLVAALSAMALFLSSSGMMAQITIVPQPQVVRIHRGMASVPASAKVYVDKKAKVSTDYVINKLSEAGFSPVIVKKASQADIAVVIGKGSGHKEGYTIATHASRPAVLATADDRSGAIYAIESIRQMLQPDGGEFKVNVCDITDWPAFPWREFMLDESRHFHGKDVVKNLLNEMTRLKMNTFHWHLVDDQGWRLEIKGYPKLTSEGSLSDYSHVFPGAEEWKKIYPNRVRSYYTQDEIREVVKYAAERGIRIVPEIEVPGHCYAPTHVYPELLAKCDDDKAPAIYDVTAPQFKKFITTVLNQVTALFPSKIVHIGGDEANYTRWKANPQINAFMKEKGLKTYADLQLYTINNIQRFLDKKGVKLIGWNEITGDNVHNEKDHEVSPDVMLHSGTLVQFWDGSPELARNAVKKGYKLVNSDSRYIYLCWPHPLDFTYSFYPTFDGLTDEQNANVLGVGTPMWCEVAPTVEKLYYYIFPRIAASAENGWTRKENKNYADFVRRMAPIEKIWQSKGYFSGQETVTMGKAQ